MEQGRASHSAYRVALRRAAHQLYDDPVVFRDPLAVTILGLHQPGHGHPMRAPRRASSSALRAYLVARAQFLEDALHAAADKGLQQYVLLGAGLDTFPYRNPYPSLQVFELDHPASQLWKRQLLRENGIVEPPGITYIPADLQTCDLCGVLQAGGFHRGQTSLFSWMGVVPYLSRDALKAMLTSLAGMGGQTELVMDYRLPASALPRDEARELESLAERLRASGEPFQLLLEPQEMEDLLVEAGFSVEQHVGADDLNRRYFPGRTDGLAVSGGGSRILSAVHRD